MKEITKQINNIRLLNNFTLQVKEGELHIVVVDSEVSISAIINLITGEYPFGSYSGDIKINGDIKSFYSIIDSERSGIGVVHQKPKFVEQMDICENIFLGSEFTSFGFINYQKCFAESARVLRDFGLNYKPDINIHRINSAERQKIEMARLIIKKVNIWFMEDLTTVLAEKEIDGLLELLKYLKNKKITVIYLGHRLKEILQVSDRVTIMRDGRTLFTEEAKNFFDEDINMSMMIGKELSRNDLVDSFCSAFEISKREKEVLLLLVNGSSNREICLKLLISINTIKTHISNIY